MLSILMCNKTIVLYISGNPFFFKPLIVLLASIPCISRDIRRDLPVLESEYIQMLLESPRVSRILMKTIINNVLVIGAYQ